MLAWPWLVGSSERGFREAGAPAGYLWFHILDEGLAFSSISNNIKPQMVFFDEWHDVYIYQKLGTWDHFKRGSRNFQIFHICWGLLLKPPQMWSANCISYPCHPFTSWILNIMRIVHFILFSRNRKSHADIGKYNESILKFCYSSGSQYPLLSYFPSQYCF